MAIKSGKPIDIIALGAATDATVTNTSSTETHEVYELTAMNNSGGNANIDLYLSDDATSASGERIDRISALADATSESFRPVTVKVSKYLIAQSDVANVNIHGSYTLRNEGDI